MPSVVDSERSEIVFVYSSCFVGTYLILKISENEIKVQSDNYSALAIMKDQISLNATNRNMQISIESDFTDDSVFHVLDKLNPLVTE